MEIVKKNKTETIVASFQTAAGVGVTGGSVKGSAWKKTADAQNGWWWNGSAWVATYADFDFVEKDQGYYTCDLPTSGLINADNEEVSIYIRAVLTGGTGTAVSNVLEQELKVGGLADEIILIRQGIINNFWIDSANNQAVLYDDSGAELLRWNLKGINDSAASTNIYRRLKVTS